MIQKKMVACNDQSSQTHAPSAADGDTTDLLESKYRRLRFCDHGDGGTTEVSTLDVASDILDPGVTQHFPHEDQDNGRSIHFLESAGPVTPTID